MRIELHNYNKIIEQMPVDKPGWQRSAWTRIDKRANVKSACLQPYAVLTLESLVLRRLLFPMPIDSDQKLFVLLSGR